MMKGRANRGPSGENAIVRKVAAAVILGNGQEEPLLAAVDIPRPLSWINRLEYWLICQNPAPIPPS